MRHSKSGMMRDLEKEFIKRLIVPIALPLLILTICLIFISTSYSASSLKTKIGYKGLIDKEQILSTLRKGEFVEDHIINGDDLIEIIRKTDLDILVRNSRIEGGLDFSKLPEEKLTEEKCPPNWSDREKEAFIRVAYPFIKYEILKKRKSDFPFVRRLHKVNNRILISDSEICRGEKYSIDGTSSFFLKKVEIERSNITGIAAFGFAVFNDLSSFQNTRFGGPAWFMDCVFIGKAEFYDSNFLFKYRFPPCPFQQ